MSIIKSTRISLTLLHIAQFYLYVIAANILLSELIFAIGSSISWNTLPLSFLIGIICLLVFYGDSYGKEILNEIIIAIIIFLFLTEFCGRVYDFSWDGNAYHKVAVGLLKNHWNPLQQTSEAMLEQTLKIQATTTIWVECYAKGAWILAASIYSITGNIECGKVFTMIGMICVFCLTYYYMRESEKNTILAFAIALASALNPIAVAQMTSFYVDGYLHSMLYILVLALAMQANRRNKEIDRHPIASIIACAMVICGTTKFTGLLCGGIYCIVYFIYYCYGQMRLGEASKYVNIKKCFGWFAGLAAVTVLWAGADTYVMNMIRYGSPFYPLYGAGAVDIITGNSPFKDTNHIKNLIISLFSKMSNIRFESGQSPEWKFPFTIDWPYESLSVGYVDARISGFGVLFSGVFVVAILSIAVKFVKKKSSGLSGSGCKIPFWVLLLLTNIGLCLAITESWWARYAPYIYFTVLLGVFFFWSMSWRHTKIKKLEKFLKVTLFVLLICNNLIFLKDLPYKLKFSEAIRDNMHSLQSYNEVEVSTVDFPGCYFNFEDQRIRYLPNDNLLWTGMGETFPYMDLKILQK